MNGESTFRGLSGGRWLTSTLAGRRFGLDVGLEAFEAGDDVPLSRLVAQQPAQQPTEPGEAVLDGGVHLGLAPPLGREVERDGRDEAKRQLRLEHELLRRDRRDA